MARLFIDGWESGDTHCWDQISGSYFQAVSGSLNSYGSYKGQITYYPALSTSWGLKNISPSNPAKLYVKFYFEFTGSGDAGEICLVQNGQGQQLALCLETSGKISVRKGNYSGTQLAVGTTVLSPNTAYLIEWYVLIGSSGALQTKISGTLDINFSGNTQNQSNNTITQFVLGNVTTGPTYGGLYRYADHLVLDDANWIGDGSIVPMIPNGAGSETQLTPSTGSNYSCVNSVPGSDSKNVSGNSNGLADTYAKASISSALNLINCIQMLIRAQGQGTPAVGGIEDVFYIGGSYYYGARQAVPTGSFANLLGMYPTSPATGNPWGISEVNGMDIGVELVT